ncbi:transposable element Tc1 transposase [Trichonephila clavipes]|nr:transposable element Tc1 transposase [Trichonephila clavipes]
MPLSRRRSYYQQLTEFERDHVIRLRGGAFSYSDLPERLDRNLSTVHDCWEQWPRDTTASRRPVSGWPRGITERENCRFRCTAVSHRTACVAMTQRTVGNRLL